MHNDDNTLRPLLFQLSSYPQNRIYNLLIYQALKEDEISHRDKISINEDKIPIYVENTPINEES